MILNLFICRGVYYRNKWYFCPPPLPFSNMIFFPPNTVKISSFPPFSPPPFPYIRVFLNKSSYFIPNKPITHISPPGGKMDNIQYTLYTPVYIKISRVQRDCSRKNRGIYYTFRSFPPPHLQDIIFFPRRGGWAKIFEFLTPKDAFLSRF